MRLEDAQFLTSDRAREALRTHGLAGASTSPLQLAAALRADGFTGDESAALATQLNLRERARARLGDQASRLLLTTDGAQQASRAALAAWHAARFVNAGVSSVADLGCGIGADALAFAQAGLRVQAVEADPATALLAAHNLADWPQARVTQGLAEQVALEPGWAAWADPARRVRHGTATRRTWNPDDFTPPLDWVFGLAAHRPLGVKLGPGHPHEAIPDAAQATWVSHRGEALEMGLWFGALAEGRPRYEATVLSDDGAARTLPGDSADPEKNRWLVNAITHRAFDPVSGQVDFKKCAARIEKIRV